MMRMFASTTPQAWIYATHELLIAKASQAG